MVDWPPKTTIGEVHVGWQLPGAMGSALSMSKSVSRLGKDVLEGTLQLKTWQRISGRAGGPPAAKASSPDLQADPIQRKERGEKVSPSVLQSYATLSRII